MLIFAFGCSDEGTEPSKNTIVGVWVRQFETGELNDYQTFTLDFRENGKCYSYVTSPLADVKPTTNDYTFINNTLIIKSEECEGVEGTYKVEFRNNGIELKLVSDDCYRSELFTGFFEKVEGPFVSPNPIMNDVNE
jgi:hypothetical protein